MKINDITKYTETIFNDLEVNDYFISKDKNVIWKKITNFVDTNAIQITNNTDYVTFGLFDKYEVVHKIKIISIDYEKVK